MCVVGRRAQVCRVTFLTWRVPSRTSQDDLTLVTKGDHWMNPRSTVLPGSPIGRRNHRRIMPHRNRGALCALLLTGASYIQGGEYPVNHPVFPVTLTEAEVASLRSQVELVMTFDRDRIAAFIVPRTTFYNVDCPNCEGGNVSNSDRWKWSAQQPDRITCKFCENSKPLAEMVVLTTYFPPIVACRDCGKKMG